MRFPSDNVPPVCPHPDGRRKMSFRTKAEAKRFATSGRWRAGNRLTVYRCKRCRLWHLTSKDA